MKRWLARLFGNARDDAPAPRQARGPAAGKGGLEGPPPGQDCLPDLDLAFYRWLAGPCSAAVPGGALLIDELERLAGQPQAAAGLVPRVPAVIPQLLRSLRDEAGSAAELARQLSQDAVLVAELIREVNSPYYRPATPVRNIEGALLLLGRNGLRMLLARVAFRPVIGMQPGQMARQLAPVLWSASEKCALAAALLAPGHGADPFEAYLAGLMLNIGLVVALRVADQALPGALPDDEAFAASLLAAVAAAIAGPGGAGFAADALGGALAAGERLARLRLLADAAQPGFERAAGALAPRERQVFVRLAESEV